MTVKVPGRGGRDSEKARRHVPKHDPIPFLQAPPSNDDSITRRRAPSSTKGTIPYLPLGDTMSAKRARTREPPFPDGIPRKTSSDLKTNSGRERARGQRRTPSETGDERLENPRWRLASRQTRSLPVPASKSLLPPGCVRPTVLVFRIPQAEGKPRQSQSR